MSELAYFVLGDFACSIWEHPRYKHLCGYIGLPRCHPWYGLDYADIPAEVHGGLTFAAPQDDDEFPHTAQLDLWWIGFDCLHLHDIAPGDPGPHTEIGGATYKDESYVRAEIENLIRQASAAIAQASTP